MSFESEKSGLQIVADVINLAMSRGAFGFNDIDLLTEAKSGLVKQRTLLDGGLAAVLGDSISPISTPTPKLAIAQPVEKSEEVIQEDSKISKK